MYSLDSNFATMGKKKTPPKNDDQIMPGFVAGTDRSDFYAVNEVDPANQTPPPPDDTSLAGLIEHEETPNQRRDAMVGAGLGGEELPAQAAPIMGEKQTFEELKKHQDFATQEKRLLAMKKKAENDLSRISTYTPDKLIEFIGNMEENMTKKPETAQYFKSLQSGAVNLYIKKLNLQITSDRLTLPKGTELQRAETLKNLVTERNQELMAEEAQAKKAGNNPAVERIKEEQKRYAKIEQAIETLKFALQ